MTELFTVYTPPAAWARFAAHFNPQVRSERVPTAAALDRVLAEPLVSPQDLPEFPRSTVDGYAVNAADTYGATPGLPALLPVVGEVPMGQAARLAVGLGEAVLVHTGGMIPPGANAVVMIENTQRVNIPSIGASDARKGDAGRGATSIEVMAPVSEGQNVIQVGEDIRTGAPVPPRIFIGSAISVAPTAGRRSRFATFSRP